VTQNIYNSNCLLLDRRASASVSYIGLYGALLVRFTLHFPGILDSISNNPKHSTGWPNLVSTSFGWTYICVINLSLVFSFSCKCYMMWCDIGTLISAFNSLNCYDGVSARNLDTFSFFSICGIQVVQICPLHFFFKQYLSKE